MGLLIFRGILEFLPKSRPFLGEKINICDLNITFNRLIIFNLYLSVAILVQDGHYLRLESIKVNYIFKIRR